MFVRNRDVFNKNQEIKFYKKWKNVDPNNISFQAEVKEGLRILKVELKELEKQNKKYNMLFN
jgi:hypothetical protein